MKVHVEVPCAIPEVGPQEVACLSYSRKGPGGGRGGEKESGKERSTIFTWIGIPSVLGPEEEANEMCYHRAGSRNASKYRSRSAG